MTQMTPRWPLTPLLLRSYVQLYPRIIVSNAHKNTWKHVDTVTRFFKNFNKRLMTPRWPLTTLLLRSHVWLYPGSLCPCPMGIHQYMWIQWSIVQNIPHTIYYIRTYVHTTYRMNDHLVSYCTQFRWDNKSLASLARHVINV